MKIAPALAVAFALVSGGATAVAAQDRTARTQISEVARAVDRYRDFSVAEREGWKKFGGDEPLMGEHWHHPEGPDYVGDAELDFSRPSNLMYTEIGGRRVLTGVAYVVRLGPGEALPEGFAGSDDRWHVHDFEKAVDAALQDRPFLGWLANAWLDDNYRDRGDNRGRLAMAHVWVTLPNPDGMFADHNRTIPYLKLGLPPEWADGASVSAARGLNLATQRGCPDVLDGPIWIANTGRAIAGRLRRSCTEAAAHVREALPSNDPDQINAMAEHGWAMFKSAWDRELSPEQKARIAAMTEHGAHDEHGSHDEPGGEHDHH